MRKFFYFSAAVVLTLVAIITVGIKKIEDYNARQGFWSMRYDFSDPDIVGVEIRKKGEIVETLSIHKKHGATGTAVIDFNSNRVTALPFGKVLFIDVNIFPGKVIIQIADKRITMWPDSVDIEGE